MNPVMVKPNQFLPNDIVIGKRGITGLNIARNTCCKLIELRQIKDEVSYNSFQWVAQKIDLSDLSLTPYENPTIVTYDDFASAIYLIFRSKKPVNISSFFTSNKDSIATITYSIPLPETDGTCNTKCPLRRFTGLRAYCYSGLHRLDLSGALDIYPGSRCPRFTISNNIIKELAF